MQVKKTVLLMMMLLLSACGYHLRGPLTLPTGLKSIYLESASPQLQEQFNASMKISSIPVANSSENASLIIRIYNLEYELVDSKNKILMARQPLSIKREYYNNQQAVIAKDNEEQIIRHEMYQQAVRSIVGGAKVALDASSK